MCLSSFNKLPWPYSLGGVHRSPKSSKKKANYNIQAFFKSLLMSYLSVPLAKANHMVKLTVNMERRLLSKGYGYEEQNYYGHFCKKKKKTQNCIALRLLN